MAHWQSAQAFRGETRRREISTAMHKALYGSEPGSDAIEDNTVVRSDDNDTLRKLQRSRGPRQKLTPSSNARESSFPDVDRSKGRGSGNNGNMKRFERDDGYRFRLGGDSGNAEDEGMYQFRGKQNMPRAASSSLPLRLDDFGRGQSVGCDRKLVRPESFDEDPNTNEAHAVEALANLENEGNCDAWSFEIDIPDPTAQTSGEVDIVDRYEDMFQFTPAKSDEIRSRLDSNISKRVSPRVCPRLASRQPRFDSPSDNGNGTMRVLSRDDRQPQTVQSQWRDLLQMLRRTKPDFFSSDEATVKDLTPTSQGKAAYFALPLNQYNNMDLQSIYVMEYDRKIRTGCSLASFKQLLTVAGQFMRMYVMLGNVNVADVWETGAVFRSVCDIETVDLFFDMFEARGQGTAVVTKAPHMKKLGKHAISYFSDKDRSLQSQAERASMKIAGVFNAYKSRARSLATERKRLEHRMLEGKFFFPQDFKDCMDKSISHLTAIMTAVNMLEADKNRDWAMESVGKNGSLIRKWFINLLLLFLFSAGGQRPQVYSQLQVPSVEEMADIEDSSQRMKFFELRTLREKSRRSLDMPNVIVPAKVMPFLKFHLDFMRPIVVKRVNVRETPGRSQPIVMHTEHGGYLTTAQIGLCLRNFLRMYRPDLSDATVMSLRSSYGTMMMQAYREKAIFQDLDERAFITKLGKVMNTSTEQLMTTYVGIDRSDYEDTAKELVSVIARDEAESAGDDTSGTDEPIHRNRPSGGLKQLFMDMF